MLPVDTTSSPAEFVKTPICAWTSLANVAPSIGMAQSGEQAESRAADGARAATKPALNVFRKEPARDWRVAAGPFARKMMPIEWSLS